MTYVVTTEGECYSAEIMSVGRHFNCIILWPKKQQQE